MQDYTKYHSDFEEEYMRKFSYPGLMEHIKLHKNLDNQIYDEYSRDISEGGMVLSSDIKKIIKKWLLDHILNEDKRYSLFSERA